MTAEEPHRTRADGGPVPVPAGRRTVAEARDRALDAGLVRIRDLAGRPRGTGFAADHHGTVITSHEAVAGLGRLLLDVPGADEGSDPSGRSGRSCVVGADAVTALPELDLALIRTDGLAAAPLPVTVRNGVRAGTYVRIAAGGWREARVLGVSAVTYEAPDGLRLLDGVLELAIGTAGRDALRPGGGAAGGPVLDAATGTVVAVLGTALRSGRRDAGFAVPLLPPTAGSARAGLAPAAGGPLAELLARNAATVPAYGPDLNLAGVLELTATSVAQDGPSGALPSRAPVGEGTAPQAVRIAGARSLRVGGAGGAGAAPGAGDAQVARGADDASGAVDAPGPGQAGDEPDAAGNAGGAQDGTGAGRPAAPVGPDTAVRPATRPDSTPDRQNLGPDRQNLAPERPYPAPDRPYPARVEPYPTPDRLDGTPDRPNPAPHRLDEPPERPVRAPLAPRLPSPPGDRVPGAPADAFVPGPGDRVPVAPADDAAARRTGGRTAVTPVERPAVVAGLAAFETSEAAVLGLVGAPGTGRTTELAALTARRARGAAPAPTLWLRGADLDGADASVADAARRALDRAARIVAAARAPLPTDVTDLTPDRVARLAHAQGRPLLLLLDGPEEMPPALAHRLAEWTEGTARWLRGTGARLVVACREEYWEKAGAQFPPELLHAPPAAGAAPHPHPGLRTATGAAPGVAPVPAPGAPLPPCLRLGDLTAEEAREARFRYGVPDDALVEADARHPLTIRLLAEVRAALPDAPGGPRLDRADVLAAHLDLMCLRIAVRLAAQNGLRGTAVRRLAAKVAGQVHEAARRSLGPGRAELDRETFAEVFPWGVAPTRLGGGTGWASAVLTEGLLVPAGDGYRFAHEELADWIQGIHLDLDEALRVMVHRRHIPGEGRRPLPVPHHRIGPVVQALLLLARRHGPRRLAVRLEELVCALDGAPHSWWASRLLAQVLLRLPDATPYIRELRLLADRIVVWQQCGLPVPRGFGPGFWTALHLPLAERCALLRRLLPADGPPRRTAEPDRGPGPQPRYLDAVADLLAADPAAVAPQLTRWFDDERPLPAAPRATVATAAQALLHTHRGRAPDELTEALAACGHPRAEELLAALAEEEPAALCRAVERWAHDERPRRRATAVAYALRTAAHAHAEADRALLRRAALAVLARPADTALHGGALALLVADPHTRPGHLPQALRHFAAGDPHLPPGALAPALATHPEAVLAAFGERLLHGPDTAEVLRALTDVTPPTLAGRVAAVVRDVVARRPDAAGAVVDCVARRLRHGPAARTVVFPLVTGLIEGGPTQLRAALGALLAAPVPHGALTLPAPVGTAAADAGPPDTRLPAPAGGATVPDLSRALRRELLDALLAHEAARPGAPEDTPAVLDAVLRAAALTAEEDLRALVHRVGLLLIRIPEGAAVFDRRLVALSREVPGFAARLTGWLADAPQDWAAVVGPSARRTIEHLAGVPVPA
ncbi:hypothetical protein JCM12681A_22160 [Streptomyces mexicanus]